MKNKNRGFIGVIVLFIILAIGAYWVLQSPIGNDLNPSTATIRYVSFGEQGLQDNTAHIKQKYNVTWTARGAKKVNIILINGNKQYGRQNTLPVDAALGSFEWTVPDVSNYISDTGKGYQIVIEEDRNLGTSSRSEPFAIFR